MGSGNLATGAVRATGLAMLSVLVLLSGILVAENYMADRAKAEIAAHRGAHVVATQFGWVFETAAHVLTRIDDTLERHGMVGFGPNLPDGARAAMAHNLRMAVRDLPAGMEYAVYDSAGTLRLSSQSAPHPDNLSDLPLFQRLRNGEAQVISPLASREEEAEPSLLMARRLGDAASFRGVAVVSIPQEMMSALAETLGFTNGSTIALVDADGLVIARSPPVPPMSLRGTAMFDAMLAAPDGTFETVSPADGVARIVGYWTLPDWPVMAIAARDRATAMEGFWRNVGMSAIFALPILFGMGWLIHDMLHLTRLDERRQRALELANERAQFLLREVHHRVKNNLATVASLIRLERLPDEVKDRLQGRITAMVAAHEAMYLSDEFEDICLRPYLDRLLGDVARGFGLAVDLRLDIPDLRLPGARAMLLGLLTNELVSNAFKHAFTPRGTGRLEVRLTYLADDWLRLVVADDGPGYAADAPGKMGSRLIEAFAQQLGGRAEVDSNGRTVVTVDFPRDLTEETDISRKVAEPQPRPAQNGSTPGSRSMKATRLSIHDRSSSRT